MADDRSGDGTMTRRRTYGQACPVAHALDLVGERWTLLMVRDLMFGPLRFSDLRDGLPGLAPNLLSQRLRWLVGHGLVEQVELPPPAARTVYALTGRGRELGPVVHELARFGAADWADPDEHPPPPRLLRGALLSLMAPERLDPQAWSVRIELSDSAIHLTVASPTSGQPLDRVRLRATTTDEHPAVDAVARTTLGALLELRRGTLARAEAQASDRLTLDGPPRVIAQLGRLFGWS